ncbi:MAG: uridine kinase [Actinomycetes bacterium]
MRVVDLSQIVSEIQARPPLAGTRMVGIDGPAGSGKSTLARRIARLLAAPIVTTDDFLSWADLDTWWPRFESDVLQPLFDQRDARYQVRDWHGDPEGTSVDRWKTVTWAPVIVVEGVTSTRRQLADRLAYRIWVEAPDDLRLERGLARDGEYWLRHWVDWLRMESEFFTVDGARQRADLIVDGNPATPHDAESQVVTR